jgi:hypothetical protein
MNWKGHGRKWYLPDLSYCPSICLEGLWNITKVPSQHSQFSDLDFNPGPPEYKAGVLHTLLQYSVSAFYMLLNKQTVRIQSCDEKCR